VYPVFRDASSVVRTFWLRPQSAAAATSRHLPCKITTVAADRTQSSEQGAHGERYLSASQVARRLACSVSLVQKWRRLGWLPATRLGPPDVPVFGYLPSDVDHFAATRWNRQRGRPRRSLSRAHQEQSPARRAPQPADSEPPARVVVHTIPPPVNTPSNTPPASSTPAPPTVALPPPSASPATSSTPAPLPARPAPRVQTARPPQPSGPPPPARGVPATASATARPSSPDQSRLPPTSGRPLLLWDADPRQGQALILARFPATDIESALATASAWSRRYRTLALGEAPTAGTPPAVLILWQDGIRQTG
jgi:hypothetical protein